MTTPSTDSLLAMQLVGLVRSQGLAGVAYWREMFQVARLDEGSLRKAMALALPALDQPDMRDPINIEVGANGRHFAVNAPETAEKKDRLRWEATPYSLSLAAEELTFAESLRETLRTYPKASPWEQLEFAQREAIVRWSDAQVAVGVPVPEVVREWPVFDPVAGFSASMYERQLATAWLDHTTTRQEPTLANEADRLMLGMALHIHAEHPDANFAELVEESRPVAEQVTGASQAFGRAAALQPEMDAGQRVQVQPTIQPPSM